MQSCGAIKFARGLVVCVLIDGRGNVGTRESLGCRNRCWNGRRRLPRDRSRTSWQGQHLRKILAIRWMLRPRCPPTWSVRRALAGQGGKPIEKHGTTSTRVATALNPGKERWGRVSSPISSAAAASWKRMGQGNLESNGTLRLWFSICNSRVSAPRKAEISPSFSAATFILYILS